MFDKVTSVTDTEVVVTTDITTAISNYTYRLRLNGLVFEGTVL
jgi:hypothetical protein